MTRILGIDPGSRITGFGIVEQGGGRIACVESGCLRIEGADLPARLKAIFDGIREVVTAFGPEEVAVERVFMHRNPDSALKLGQARGAAICAVTVDGLPVNEYTPAEIKLSVVGKGNAAKAQVQHMVQAMLGLSAAPQADAADALAVALCHLHTRQTVARMGERGGVLPAELLRSRGRRKRRGGWLR